MEKNKVMDNKEIGTDELENANGGGWIERLTGEEEQPADPGYRICICGITTSSHEAYQKHLLICPLHMR